MMEEPLQKVGQYLDHDIDMHPAAPHGKCNLDVGKQAGCLG
jgi:hypothetical protein